MLITGAVDNGILLLMYCGCTVHLKGLAEKFVMSGLVSMFVTVVFLITRSVKKKRSVSGFILGKTANAWLSYTV